MPCWYKQLLSICILNHNEFCHHITSTDSFVLHVSRLICTCSFLALHFLWFFPKRSDTTSIQSLVVHSTGIEPNFFWSVVMWWNREYHIGSSTSNLVVQNDILWKIAACPWQKIGAVSWAYCKGQVTVWDSPSILTNTMLTLYFKGIAPNRQGK